MLMLAPSDLDKYSYEVARAKATINGYNQHTFRAEFINQREGVDGSVINTYCAIVQSRDVNQKVKEQQFYWVVSVKPASGYLSDYERGSYDLSDPGSNVEYAKLCESSKIESDNSLLTSAVHTSDGSVFDPTDAHSELLSKDWLVGSWVYNDSCATHRDELFRSDHYYEGSFGIGIWSMNGSKVSLTIEQQGTFDEERHEIVYRHLPNELHESFMIKALGPDRASINDEFFMLRC